MNNIERVVRMYRDHTVPEIARITGLSRGTVQQYAYRGGIKRQFYRLNYLQTAKLLGQRAKGATLHELSRTFGISVNSVAVKCRKYGLSTKMSHAALTPNQEDKVWEAVARSDSYIEFVSIERSAYYLARKHGMIDTIKEKFDE